MIKKIQRKIKGSALVVTMIILGVILVSTLSISLVSVQERKASIGENKSNQAYQTADTGVEKVMQLMGDNVGGNLASIGCISGAITSTTEGYTIKFKDASNNFITDCGTPIASVKTVKSIGTIGDNQRAVEVAVKKSGCLIEKTYEKNGFQEAESVIQTADGGYIISGSQESSTTNDHAAFLMKIDSSGNEEWFRVYDNPDHDEGQEVIELSDGSFFMVGITNKTGFYCDMMLIKTDSSGNQTWRKTFSETSNCEWGHSIVKINDGNYVLVGRENGSNSPPYDSFYAVKVNGSGTKLWDKSYGGSNNDYIYEAGQVVAATDGGFVMAGSTGSTNITGCGLGLTDAYIVKANSSGTRLWQKCYGGAAADVLSGIIRTSDGGYAAIGWDEDSGPNQPYWMYLLKIDSSGNKQWSKRFGAITGTDMGFQLDTTQDGGYILAGETSSLGEGGKDFYLVKVNNSGTEQWYETFGTADNNEGAKFVFQDNNQAYVMVGSKYPISSGGQDIYFVKYSCQE